MLSRRVQSLTAAPYSYILNILNSRRNSLRSHCVFQITDLHLTEMEDRCGESRVHARECLEEGDEILDLARTAGSDHRHMDSFTDLLQHLQVKALLHPVRINGIDHDLARALTDAAADPLNSFHAGVLPSALGKHAKTPSTRFTSALSTTHWSP